MEKKKKTNHKKHEEMCTMTHPNQNAQKQVINRKPGERKRHVLNERTKTGMINFSLETMQKQESH